MDEDEEDRLAYIDQMNEVIDEAVMRTETLRSASHMLRMAAIVTAFHASGNFPDEHLELLDTLIDGVDYEIDSRIRTLPR